MQNHYNEAVLNEKRKTQIKTVKSTLSEMYDRMYKYIRENHAFKIKGNVILVKEIGDVIHVSSVLENVEEMKYLGQEEANIKY